MIKTITFLVLIIAILMGYSHDLQQRNAEELFLSQIDAKKLQEFQQNFGVDQNLLILLDQKTDKEKLKVFFEDKNSTFIDLSKFKANQALVQLPELEDQAKLELITQLEQQFEKLHIIGMPYTNAHLAAMSLKIQKIIFPIVFIAVILLTFLVFKNIQTTLWLFLNAFVGVPITLSLIKLIYGHSTILTTISPLVTFILSYGLFLHLLYGRSHYPNRDTFYRHKITPIIVMMITTIAGFLGLLSSDLVSIQQFATITALALTLAWTLTFIIFHYIEIKLPPLPQLKFIQPNTKILSKNVAIVVLLVSCFGGGIAITRMPPLTEAIYFFPSHHPIQTSIKSLVDLNEGTPVVDLIITKKNGEELKFEDFKHIQEIEKHLPNNILSLNHMIAKANQIYSGNISIPEQSIAYFALKSQVPLGLTDSYSASKAYRISILSPPSHDQTKEAMINNIQLLIDQSTLLKEYNIELSGLSYLVFRSQSHLIQSLISSFALSFLIIVFIFAMYARNMKKVMVFFIINFASVCGGLFIMYLTGMTLNVSSIMTVSVTIGLVVDSTVHIMHSTRTKDAALDLGQVVYPAILVNHIVFIAGFMILAFQDFLPIRDFALGLIILMLYGLFVDLFILAALENKKATF
jgi:uncharacterized protein